MEFAGRAVARGATGLVVVLIVAAGWWAVSRPSARDRLARASASAPIAIRGPTVEVINGTKQTGLARQVTRLLRQRGADVLYYGSSRVETDSTTVVVRRGDLARGHEIARLLGVSRVVSQPDSNRRVDCSVIVGTDFRFPKGWLAL